MLEYTQTKSALVKEYWHKYTVEEKTQLLKDLYSKLGEFQKVKDQTQNEICILKNKIKKAQSEFESIKIQLDDGQIIKHAKVFVRVYKAEKRVEYIDLNDKVLYTRAAFPDELFENLFGEPNGQAAEKKSEEKSTEKKTKLNKNGFPILEQAPASEVSK